MIILLLVKGASRARYLGKRSPGDVSFVTAYSGQEEDMPTTPNARVVPRRILSLPYRLFNSIDPTASGRLGSMGTEPGFGGPRCHKDTSFWVRQMTRPPLTTSLWYHSP